MRFFALSRLSSPLLATYPFWRIARKGSHLPSFSGKDGGQRGERNSAKLSKVGAVALRDDNSIEFRIRKERMVWFCFIKIIINFSLENVYIRCRVLEKVTFFDPLPKNRSNWSLKRSKRDILAAILSRGSRLHRDRVAALNITRVPLKFLKEIVDRVSWLCRSDTTFPPVKSLFAGRV